MPMFPPEVHRSHLTPLRFLQRSASVFRQKPAVVYGDRSWTYPELDGAGQPPRLRADRPRVSSAATGSPSWFPNIPPMLEGHFAVPLAGAILVAINTRLVRARGGVHPRALRGQGARRRYRAGAPGRAVAGATFPTWSSSSASRTSPAASRLPGPDYEAFLASGSPEPLDWPLEDEDETIAIDYTSGTTGRPKGVMYTHRGAYLNSLGELLETRMTSDSVYLWTLPMFHCNGWCYPWAVTAIGGTHVCLRKLDPEMVWRLVAERGRHPLLRRARRC